MINMPSRSLWIISFLTAGIGIFIVLTVVNPLWTQLKLHVPGEPETLVNFTQPVDSVFYVRNAEHGYSWKSSSPTSIWFHPLLVLAINILPSEIPANNRFWIISIASAIFALVLIANALDYFSTEEINPWLITFAVLIPGGLGIATGNAEFACLVFTTILLFSVVNNNHWFFPMLFGGLAILTKPNALYMVPVLGVYLIHGYIAKDRKLVINSLIGISSILLIFFVWILFVDFKSQEFGAFWIARKVATVPLTNGMFSFLERSVRTFLFVHDGGENLKFATAFFIPIVDIWLALVIPLKREVDRTAMIIGLGAIIISTFILNNPNKVVTYVTTLPAHFIISLLFIKESFTNSGNNIEKLVRRLAGLTYIGYCFVIMLFFILGTPFGWYY
jgi:hypothetical protein